MVGRPRSAECDRAILDAALVEYASGGLDGMSVDAVAARAGVSKATIYRRYPSKIDLVMAAALMLCEETTPKLDAPTLEQNLREMLRNLARTLADPVYGAAKRTLLFDAVYNDELARMHASLVAARRERTLSMLRAATERGEMRADVDMDFAVDQLGAPLFYRHLLMHEDIADAYIDKVVSDFMARYGATVDAGAESNS